MHDYYIVKTTPKGRRFYNHVDKGWDRCANDSLYTVQEATKILASVQSETVFPVSLVKVTEVR